MATRQRGGIQAVIPWVALAVVTVFAFGQLHQRNRALERAGKAEDELRAVQVSGTPAPSRSDPGTGSAPVPPTPGAADAAAVAAAITPRERKLDAALQAALDVTRGDSKRLAALETALEGERVRAERALAQLTAESARSAALQERLGSVDEGAAARATQLAADLAAERQGRGRDLAEHQRALTEVQAVAERLSAALEASEGKHAAAVAALTERFNRMAVERTTAESRLAQMREVVAREEVQRKQAHARIAQQLETTAGALEKAQAALEAEGAARAHATRLAARAVEARAAAEQALGALRKRMRVAAAAQLHSEDPLTRITGARMVALLRLSGLADGLLELTSADESEVVAAAAQALATVPDLPEVALQASDAAVALLADDAIEVRMAGLALLQAATRRSIAFDPGASADARAAALQKLKKQLGS